MVYRESCLAAAKGQFLPAKPLPGPGMAPTGGFRRTVGDRTGDAAGRAGESPAGPMRPCSSLIDRAREIIRSRRGLAPVEFVGQAVGHYEHAIEEPVNRRVVVAFAELAGRAAEPRVARTSAGRAIR